MKQLATQVPAGGVSVCIYGAWIAAKTWQFVIDNQASFNFHWVATDKCHTREAWLAAHRDAASQFERCWELVKLATGRPKAEAATKVAYDAFEEVDDELKGAQAKSIDDLKMQAYAASREGVDIRHVLELNMEALLHSIMNAPGGDQQLQARLKLKPRWKNPTEKHS